MIVKRQGTEGITVQVADDEAPMLLLALRWAGRAASYLGVEGEGDLFRGWEHQLAAMLGEGGEG